MNQEVVFVKIGELKKLIENADDDGEVWMQVYDERKWVDCVASIDDNGILAIQEKQDS